MSQHLANKHVCTQHRQTANRIESETETARETGTTLDWSIRGCKGRYETASSV